MCPGRHFATNEILAVVSMFVLRYEMTPTAGEWSLPTTEKTNLAAVVMEPNTDVEVEVWLRKGFQDGRWVYSIKDFNSVFAIVAEDT